MPTEMTSSAQQDESAVAAVWRGDAERYRELVERHERRVFAVAWSRLGDAALAEEAAQEAFIRGYRRLWLLGDGHQIVHAGREHRERTGVFAAVHQFFQLRRAADATDEMDAFARARVVNAENRPKNSFLQQCHVQILNRVFPRFYRVD